MIERVKRPLLLATMALLLLFAWIGSVPSNFHQISLDARAHHYVDEGFKRALVTFAAARTLNAALSVLQGTQVAVEPAGVGVQVSPGQALRPINDLVHQFAEITLLAGIVFGAMELLLAIGSHWTISLALSATLVPWAALQWQGLAPRWLARVVLVLVVLRFAVPLVSIASDVVYTSFMADRYATSHRVIETSSQSFTGEEAAKGNANGKAEGKATDKWWGKLLSLDPARTDDSFLAQMKQWFFDIGDVRGRVEKFVRTADGLVESIVKLIVVFVLQTIVIPLIVGWALIRITSALLQFGPLNASPATKLCYP